MPAFGEFAKKWNLDTALLGPVDNAYPFKLSACMESLIGQKGDAIWKQFVPDADELADDSGLDDPLSEESLSPVPNLVHRYPNRVLWLVHDRCAVHCRFCTRKRRWRAGCSSAAGGDLGPALDYIRRNPQIRDVLLSGGDPLLLPMERLREILQKLREIEHVDIVRIGSRVPGALPRKITPELAGMLGRFHPIYLNLHFNHPAELTAEAREACSLLANAGIPLGSQTVLLRGVNDSEAVLGTLFHGLLAMRVRPYYLMQMDLTRSTAHFRTPVGTGLRILKHLRNRISGLAMPHFVIDLPGGNGKVALVPQVVRRIGDGELVVENYLGKRCTYPLLDGEETELRRFLQRGENG